MSKIGRFAKSRAKAGKGDELAAKLLEAAEQVEGTPGCELYVVARDPGDPDVVFVNEIWRSQEDVDAALEQARESDLLQETLPLIEPGSSEIVATTPVGGVGLVDAAEGVPPYTLVSVDEVTDMAAQQGFGEMGAARFANGDLEAKASGVSFQTLNPGKRQQFGHRHRRAEEVYVVTHGSGRVKLDDEVVEIGAQQAIRVAPPVARAFEAGPDGLELIAFSTQMPGDAEVLMGWWKD